MFTKSSGWTFDEILERIARLLLDRPRQNDTKRRATIGDLDWRTGVDHFVENR